jgi:hypothetical protein
MAMRAKRVSIQVVNNSIIGNSISTMSENNYQLGNMPGRKVEKAMNML